MAKKRDVETQREFGEWVRELRKRKGFSQESLALACDLDRTYIGGVERGERNISLVNILKISRALGVPPGKLFTYAERRR
jgi:transcriptional regulator with XRE-family HTH domain